jgi:hypothetical protein
MLLHSCPGVARKIQKTQGRCEVVGNKSTKQIIKLVVCLVIGCCCWQKCSLLCRECKQLEPELLSLWLDASQGTLLLKEQRDIALRDVTLRRATSLGMLKEKKEDGDSGNSALCS